MGKNEIQQLFISILHSALNEVEDNSHIAQNITNEDVLDTYRLAKKHDLAHIVSNFVYKNKVQVEDGLKAKLQKAEMISVYRYEQIKFAFNEICSILDESNIQHIALKGSTLRPYYPYESMRTSCDIDILVREEDLDFAIKELEQKGYKCGKRHFHDVSLFSPNDIHLELHFRIEEGIDSLDAVLKDAWQYAVQTKGNRYDFANEFFVFHMYAHMAYHFLMGGCGIRSLMDIWVMERKMDLYYTCAEELLKKAGIYKFAVEMSSVANRCFSENSQDEFAELILKYVFNGGVYGNTENSVAVQKSKNNSSIVYIFKRAFLPYKYMVLTYPILKKAPYLLPLCWVIRWIKALLDGKKSKISNEMTYVNKISQQMIEETKTIRSRLGI